jgi:hypothetical protein
MILNRLANDHRSSARTSHAIRTRTTEESWLEIDSTMVDELTSQPLPAPRRQLMNLIGWLKLQAGDAPFEPQEVRDCDALAGIAGAVDGIAFARLLEWASTEGLVELSNDGKIAVLTPKAWEDEPSQKILEPIVSTTNDEIQVCKGHCPKCGADRHAEIVASHEEHSKYNEGLIWTNETFNILKCRGCGEIYVQRQYQFSEDEEYDCDPRTGEFVTTIEPHITYWPAPARRNRPDWLNQLPDDALRELLYEVYGALDADHRVLAAIGTRTALDRAMTLKGATEVLGFGEKLGELKAAGVISQQEKELLTTLTDAGSAAAHRGWRPEPNMLDTIMDGTEAFLQRALILGAAIDAIKKDVPPRPSRPKRRR